MGSCNGLSHRESEASVNALLCVAISSHSTCWIGTTIIPQLSGFALPRRCANIHACGPKDRWAPFPCLLDKHGEPFRPVFEMARVEHARILALGPMLLLLRSQHVLRLAPSHATPIVKVGEGIPLNSISSGKWLIGHFSPAGRLQPGGGVAGSVGDCVMIVNDVSTTML